MAEISKISGVAIGDVAKVDAVLKADIADINGLTIPADGAPAAAYSVRLLGSAVGVPTYTGDCMRVRRDSDNTEQDIGFDGNGDLDTAAIATFVGSGNNGYIRYWYDQSGNAVDAGQSTAGSQPQIYNGSAVITAGPRPALDHDGSGWLTLGVSDLSTTNLFAEASDPFSVMCAAQCDNLGSGTIFSKATSTGSNRTLQLFKASSNQDRNVNIRGVITATGTGTSDRFLQEAHWDGSAAVVAENGTETSASVGTALENSDNINIGSRTDGSFILQGKTQEIIVYGNAQDSTNRAAIRSNMNTYFTIYT